MTKRTGTDKSLFHVPKEVIGQPWTYTAETKAKLSADKSAAPMDEELRRIASPLTYDTKPSQGAGAMRPKNTKHPLQQTNGHRSQCVGYKAGAKVGSERDLPKPAPDYTALARKTRARRGKMKASKLRAAPCVK